MNSLLLICVIVVSNILKQLCMNYKNKPRTLRNIKDSTHHFVSFLLTILEAREGECD